MNLRKKWPWLAALAFVLTAVVVVHHILSRPDPVYNGKPLGMWFKLAADQQDREAVEVFHKLGPASVPFLARELRRGQSRWDEFYYSAYPKIPRPLQRNIPYPPIRYGLAAARLLAGMGSDAEPAYNEMVSAYDYAYCKQFGLPRHSTLDWNAQFTNPPAWSASNLVASDVMTRRWLLIGFCKLTNAHNKTLPMLLAACREPGLDSAAVTWATQITNYTTCLPLAEPTLLIAMTDSTPAVRETATELLGRLAPDHPEVVPLLVKAAEDPVKDVRLNALKALGKVHMPFEKSLLLAGKALENPEPSVRSAGMSLLFKSAGGFRNLDVKLTEALDSHNPAVRAAAAAQLGRFGAKSLQAVPKLTQLLSEMNEPDIRVRELAAGALAKITNSPTARK